MAIQFTDTQRQAIVDKGKKHLSVSFSWFRQDACVG